MKKLVTFFVLSFAVMQVAEAKPRRVYSYTNNNYSNVNNATAQGVAEAMARNRRVGHFGGNTGYEGCGSGMTREQAYNNCCFARSGMATVDVGYAQDSSGRWYCCRRYR